jgi:hypothetical protein
MLQIGHWEMLHQHFTSAGCFRSLIYQRDYVVEMRSMGFWKHLFYRGTCVQILTRSATGTMTTLNATLV